MSAPESWLLPLQAAATLAMLGVIWFVQVVHYPLMARVGQAGFAAYGAANVRSTTWVVAPLMLLEATTAAGLCRWPPAWIGPHEAWLGAGLNWLRTALWSARAALILCWLLRAPGGAG